MKKIEVQIQAGECPNGFIQMAAMTSRNLNFQNRRKMMLENILESICVDFQKNRLRPHFDKNENFKANPIFLYDSTIRNANKT